MKAEVCRYNERGRYRNLVRLASKELTKDLAPWWSLAFSSAFTAMGISFYIGGLVRGSQFEGNIGKAYLQSGATGVAVLIIVSLFTIVSSSKVAVILQRKDILIWRLTGVSERQAKLIVVAEIIITSTLGTVVGTISSFALWPLWKLILQAADMPYAASLAFPPLAVLPIVVISLTITATLGGIKAGNDAASLRPVMLLKSAQTGQRKFQWLSWTIGVAAFSSIIYLLFIAQQTSPQSDITEITQKTTFIYLGTSVLYTLIIGAMGKVFVTRFLRLWTAIVPERWSRSWFLASRQAEHDLQLSSSLVVPLSVSLILITGIFGYVGQAEDAARAFNIAFAGKGIDVGALIQLLGMPILITLINAGGLAMATGTTKRRDANLLYALGSSQRQIYFKLIFESFILVFTASLIALIVYFLNGFSFFIALRYGPIVNAHFIWPSLAPYSVALVALIILIFASAVTYRGLSSIQSKDLH